MSAFEVFTILSALRCKILHYAAHPFSKNRADYL